MSHVTASVLVIDFECERRARTALEKMRAARFTAEFSVPAADIKQIAVPGQSSAEDLQGAIVGAVVGAITCGWLGLVAGLMTSVGSDPASNDFAFAVGFAFAGAALGGILGALIGLNRWEERAILSREKRVRRRATLRIQTEGRIQEVLQILRACKSERPEGAAIEVAQPLSSSMTDSSENASHSLAARQQDEMIGAAVPTQGN